MRAGQALLARLRPQQDPAVPRRHPFLAVMRMAAVLRGRAIRLLALAAAAFLFAGCAQDEGRYPSFCPQVAVLDVPSQLTRFREGSGRSRPDLLFQATIKHVETMCEVGKDKADVQQIGRASCRERGCQYV